MFGVGGHWIYLIILLVVVLLVFGPGKLPEVGSGLGRAIREFRKASTDVKDQLTGSFGDEAPPPPAQPAAPTGAPSSDATPAGGTDKIKVGG